MNNEWQSFAAPVVVLITLIGFAIRSARKKKHGGGCASCSGASRKVTLDRK